MQELQTIMSSRYDFELAVNLKENVPVEIIELLAYLLTPDTERPHPLPDDPMFIDSWLEDPPHGWVESSEPHAGNAICSFRRVYRFTKNKIDHFQYTLHLRFSAKIEEICEVGLLFARWLAQWSDQNEHVGYFKGELSQQPCLLYIHDGELYLREVSEPPRRAADGALWE